ncbi:hypothetical protein Ancab_011204 [Ancistrocladus abbreviatus]
MEFWGVEIKGEKPVKLQPDDGQVFHLSQATLGELKKGGEPVILSARVGVQKLVIGILTPDNFPQLSFNLVFEKEFELSHNWKNGSVHLCGYKTDLPDEDEDFSGSDYSEDEEGLPLKKAENVKLALSAPVKPESQPAEKPKQDIKAKEDEDDDSEEDEDDSDDEEDESDDEDMIDSGETDDNSDEDGTEEDKEQPAKLAHSGKKRPSSATKTPKAKKAKVATPQKTDGKKGAHTATPHPAKKAGKTPTNGDKSKAQTPKSTGQVTCITCKKTFNSDNALQSHTKAKHSAGK